MSISLREILNKNMLNRRILRIKAFKVLYSSVLAADVTLKDAEKDLDLSCESARDLYVFMLGIVSPLTRVARERLESARKKFNPTEEERNPNMKFADNALAKLLAGDPDFDKAMKKRKFSWEQYDLFLKKVYSSIIEKPYYKKYMAAEESSLAADCALFVKIFEQEFVDSPELEQILEDMSIYWNDDLAYALTYCCRTVKEMAKTQRWELPPLYQSDMKKDELKESDRQFVHKLLQNAYAGWQKYVDMVAASVDNWDNDRIVTTDMALIVMGLAEIESFPSIPLKVSLNEYIEISKFYGTPKSKIFVNGMLDRISQKMISDGIITKN